MVTAFIGISATSEVAKLRAWPAWRVLAISQAVLWGNAMPSR